MDSKVWIIISIAILACCGHAQGYGTEADDKDHPDEGASGDGNRDLPDGGGGNGWEKRIKALEDQVSSLTDGFRQLRTDTMGLKDALIKKIEEAIAKGDAEKAKDKAARKAAREARKAKRLAEKKARQAKRKAERDARKAEREAKRLAKKKARQARRKAKRKARRDAKMKRLLALTKPGASGYANEYGTNPGIGLGMQDLNLT